MNLESIESNMNQWKEHGIKIQKIRVSIMALALPVACSETSVKLLNHLSLYTFPFVTRSKRLSQGCFENSMRRCFKTTVLSPGFLPLLANADKPERKIR